MALARAFPTAVLRAYVYQSNSVFNKYNTLKWVGMGFGVMHVPVTITEINSESFIALSRVHKLSEFLLGRQDCSSSLLKGLARKGQSERWHREG